MKPTRMIVGCMSGTSMDGIDAALVRVHGTGLNIRVELVRSASVSLDDADELRGFTNGHPLSAQRIRSLAVRLGEQHCVAIASTLGQDEADLIVLHGQTVLHEPPLSWQLIDPWPVAAAFGCRVVSDLRSRSLATGGQGSPLTPLADWVLFRDPNETRTVVNLGGFANFTALPTDADPSIDNIDLITGGDICACNLVLDRLARDRLGTSFDEDGRAALTGEVSTAEAARLSNRLKPDHERSLGTGDEAQWFDDELASLSPTDCLATACDAIARTITSQLPASDATVIAGGGSCNRALMRSFASHRSGRILESDAFGIPSQMREAVGFAVLGALADDGIPVTLPAITGSVTEGRDGQWILP